MRVLFLTESLPYPLDSGGRIRSFHILEALCSKHKVTLVTSIDSSKSITGLEIFKAMCEDLIVVPCRRVSWHDNFSLIRNEALAHVPLFMRRYYRSAVSQALAGYTDTTNFDVLHYDHLDATIYRSFAKGSFHEVVDEHNIVTNQFLSTASAQPHILQSLLLKRFVPSIRRYESRVCSSVCHCFVCSHEDSQSLSRLAPAATISTIPNGVDLDFYSPRSTPFNQLEHQKSRSLVFVGSLDYSPCEIGVFWFIREILPFLRSQISDLKFTIVGRNPSNRLQLLVANDPLTSLTGFVADTRPFLAEADAAVIPLLSGSGTRLKILEAMAMRIPVVSTVIGAQGIAVQDGANILLADLPQSFAAAVLKVLSSKTFREQICEQALKLVKNQYSWKTIQSHLLETYDALASCPCKN